MLARFLNPNARDTVSAVRYDTSIWTTKMNGITPRSTSFDAESCEASFVKTAHALVT